MKKLLVAAGLAASLASASQADASAGGSTDVERIYEAGQCILQQHDEEAHRLMRTLPLDSREVDLSSLSSVRSCAGLSAGMPSILLRGAIAQAMFFRDFREFGREPTRVDRLVDLDLPVQASPAHGQPADLYRWSDCVVRNDTQGTHDLLASPVGSAEEGEALQRLQTYMSACFDGDGQMTARRSEIRSVLAQSAYHVMYRYWTAELVAH